jgi:hypothetical protein
MDAGSLAALVFIVVIGLLAVIIYVDGEIGKALAYVYAYAFWGGVAVATLGVLAAIFYG